jgi:hypothetical protein
MIRPMLVAAMLGGVISAGCVSQREKAAAPHGKCSVTSLTEVFKNPLMYHGKRFCGSAMAYRRIRVVEVFPDGPPPDDPLDTVMFLSREADLAVKEKLQSAGKIRLYLEGKIDLQKPCYRPHPGGDTCIPYTHPMDLKVTYLEFR